MRCEIAAPGPGLYTSRRKHIPNKAVASKPRTYQQARNHNVAGDSDMQAYVVAKILWRLHLRSGQDVASPELLPIRLMIEILRHLV